MKKEKDKICNICHLTIDENKEFAKLTHYKNKDKVWTEGFYHIQCYSKRLCQDEDNKKLQAIAMDTLLKTRQKLGIGERC